MEDVPRTVSVAEAKTHLSELVAAVEAGETISITKRGRPVASLVSSVRQSRAIDLGFLRESVAGMPIRGEDAAQLLRRARDEARY